MQIAHYWSKVESTAQTPAGKAISFVCWRGSESSVSEAQALARQAAERMAARIRSGQGFPERYAYPGRQLREEVLQQMRDPHGNLQAALTRNAYGSQVLNAAQLLFIDVDLAEPPPARAAASAAPAPTFFGRLTSAILGAIGAAPSPADAGAPAANADAATANAKRKQWLDAHRDWGMRVYRTRSGLRYLVTHALFEPGGPESEAAMQSLACDPNYVQLCRIQKSFRARLTPKPWRCGMRRPPARFPWENAAQEQHMRAWEKDYAAACRPWATCALVEVVGNPQIHPAAAPLIKLHDDHTRAESGLPLA